MIAIGRYFVFIVLMTETILSAPSFSKREQNQFLKKILKLHNEYRIKHGVRKLKLDAKLSKKAEEILINLRSGDEYELPNDVGVNVFYRNLNIHKISKLDFVEANTVLLYWYNTSAGYDYNNEPSKKKAKTAGKFTQIVWKNTKRLGLKIEVYENGYYEVLAVYSPRGNEEQQYTDNVLQPLETQESEIKLINWVTRNLIKF